jgi:hypothetical protein
MALKTERAYKVLSFYPHIALPQVSTLIMQFSLLKAFDYFNALFFLYLLLHFRDRRRRGALPYPPGPPSWPIIGNLLDIPRDLAWRGYTDMSKKYGECNILADTGLP